MGPPALRLVIHPARHSAKVVRDAVKVLGASRKKPEKTSSPAVGAGTSAPISEKDLESSEIRSEIIFEAPVGRFHCFPGVRRRA
jgi:hypothetical protein